MEYIGRTLVGKGCGAAGKKRLYWMKYDGHWEWRSCIWLGKRHNKSPDAIRRRIDKNSPLDVSKAELCTIKKTGGNRSNLEELKQDKQVRGRNLFLLAPSHLKAWNHFHKQGTDNWIVCSRCGDELPRSEYVFRRRPHRVATKCIACHSVIRFEQKSRARACA